MASIDFIFIFIFLLFLSDSKLGVPIKTTVSATVLEEALNGVVEIRPLLLGQPMSRKVRHLFSGDVSIVVIVLCSLLNCTFLSR